METKFNFQQVQVIDPDLDILGGDLREEYAAILGRGAEAEYGEICIFSETPPFGDPAPAAEWAHYLYIPAEGRLGIAWGAGASWADVPSVDEGIYLWLNDPEEWESRN